MNKSLSIFLVLMFIGIFVPSHARALDGCGFGYSYDYENMEISEDYESLEESGECIVTTWTYSKSNDGFAKYFSISMSPDDEDDTNTGVSDIQIFCDKKKIEVYVWVEYADSYGWKGSGQVRFDSGTPRKLPYLLQKDFDGVVVTETKTFMQNLVKAKSKVSFKIPTVNGYEVLVYPKGNLMEFRPIFAKAGCKF